ncbi:MAG: HAMP domain-containing histidine kinase [Verrucomicrobiaceae bacterium]|nr:HAMP domain-containing histidine kinase [Verrucomicrobiaceae bacterium]
MNWFRHRLLASMMLVVTVTTATVLYFAQSRAAGQAEASFRAANESRVAEASRIRQMRHAALTERCKSLVRRPRIHAALEDDALDLLYVSAVDELADLLEPDLGTNEEDFSLHAKFYRFLDVNGKVIPPEDKIQVGRLSIEEEKMLALARPVELQQLGYLIRDSNRDHAPVVDEIIASPIISLDTHEIIACLVLGFAAKLESPVGDAKSGLWVQGKLLMNGAEPEECERMRTVLADKVGKEDSSEVKVGGKIHRVFFRALNRGSVYPEVYEVSCFDLTPSLEQQRKLRWQIMGIGGGLLLCGLVASHLLSSRLARPVERLAKDSAIHQAERLRAESELQAASVELERSTRFSADASHQLKTPVTVLRAGLEALLKSPALELNEKEEVSRLIDQTSRLSGMIHDLLLLARLESGRMSLSLGEVNLTSLIDSLQDDLSAVPSSPDFDVEVDVPKGMLVLGEKRYVSMILQNLLENAWKYNQPGGRITINAEEDGRYLVVTIGNTGAGIPPEFQELVFERFHRASVGENVPGHGLGLNLARELARLHGGDLRLVTSSAGWTEFEVRFLKA